MNIMVKGDRDIYRNGEKLPPRYQRRLGGFARIRPEHVDLVDRVLGRHESPAYTATRPSSRISSRMQDGRLKKTIVLKVSDFHSAAVQGKFLAKRGLWVSEYRVESGLNCGGHAFATKGLAARADPGTSSKSRREELVEQLHVNYAEALRHAAALSERRRMPSALPRRAASAPPKRICCCENLGVDGTGWATLFLLVPEVTNLDDEHRRKLCEASNDDVYLSDSSPFGLPFWNLRTSASEKARRRRIAEGRPGSPCVKGYVKLFNTEFTETPICTASREYQKLKLEQLERQDIPEAQRAAMREACWQNRASATIWRGRPR